VPNLLTCNTILGICERSGKLQYALWVFEEVQKLGLLPDATTHAIMERVREKGGQEGVGSWGALGLALAERAQDGKAKTSGAPAAPADAPRASRRRGAGR